MQIKVALTLCLIGYFIFPNAAHAYIGPGVGIASILVVVVILGIALLSIVSLIWLLIKAKIKKD